MIECSFEKRKSRHVGGTTRLMAGLHPSSNTITASTSSLEMKIDCKEDIHNNVLAKTTLGNENGTFLSQVH